MLRSDYEDQNCAIARALEVVGERWTILIVRDALLGIRRFEDFQGRLGVSRTVLTERLALLVEHGVLERSRYQRRPDRFEYVLTDRGRELWPVVAALAQWGAERSPNGAARSFRHHSCPTSVHAEVRCPDCGEELPPDEVLTAPTKSATTPRAEHIAQPVLDALARARPLLQPARS
jgi:DNA-binding HxlR family transcriptional regulator